MEKELLEIACLPAFLPGEMIKAGAVTAARSLQMA